MSSNDHPESGVPDPSEHELGATTSPQGRTQPAAGAAKPSPVPDHSAPITAPSAAVMPPAHTPSGDAATANHHPATGGESTAPVTATASSTTTSPPNDTPNAAAQPQNPADLPTMDTEEPKVAAELSEEQTEEVDGKEVEDVGPSLAITLLLITGARHPFTIDGKYLRKRSVNVENYDPYAMSVYTLKELIWREWRSGKLALGRRRLGIRCTSISDLGMCSARLGKSPCIAELHSLDILWQIVG